MVGIKQDILRRLESFPTSVNICGVKFIQRVVLVQTMGLVSDPRVCIDAFLGRLSPIDLTCDLAPREK